MESKDTKKFQFYSTADPEMNEIVLVIFNTIRDGFFDANLLEYPDYTGIMNFKDATKKRRVTSWNKIVPLNKEMIAYVEDVNKQSKTVQLSITYLEEEDEKEKEKNMMVFEDNKKMEKFINSICIVNNYDFTEIWTKLIHYIDTLRMEYNEDENEDEEDITIWKYFNDNIDSLEQWIKDSELTSETYNELGNMIKGLYDKKNITAPQKIINKFSTISSNSIVHTKKLFENTLKLCNHDFKIKYVAGSNYTLESESYNILNDDHMKFLKLLESESQKCDPKVYVKINM